MLNFLKISSVCLQWCSAKSAAKIAYDSQFIYLFFNYILQSGKGKSLIFIFRLEMELSLYKSIVIKL